MIGSSHQIRKKCIFHEIRNCGDLTLYSVTAQQVTRAARFLNLNQYARIHKDTICVILYFRAIDSRRMDIACGLKQA